MKTLNNFRGRQSETFHMPPASVSFLVITSILLSFAILFGLVLYLE